MFSEYNRGCAMRRGKNANENLVSKLTFGSCGRDAWQAGKGEACRCHKRLFNKQSSLHFSSVPLAEGDTMPDLIRRKQKSAVSYLLLYHSGVISLIHGSSRYFWGLDYVSPFISASAFSSQKRVSISRHIAVAIAKFSIACSGFPARRDSVPRPT